MPADHRTVNGLTTYSAHVSDEASSDAIANLEEETRAQPGLAAQDQRESDPESAARRYLSSPGMPTLTGPEADGTSSTFKVINTETVPLTQTRVVKFRQTLHDIPIYGSLVTVELGERNELVAIDSALGQPTGVDPVASIAPTEALEAAAASPDGYTPDLEGVVPRLHYYFDKAASSWRLVYFLEDVAVSQDGGEGPEGNHASGFEPPHFVTYVVDAHDGSVVAILPRTPSLAPEGEQQTAKDSYGVERSFRATAQGGTLVLRDTVHNVSTYDFGFRDPEVEAARLPGNAITRPPDWSPAAVSAHANAAAVADFMRTVLMRNNIDNQGGTMTSTINCVVQRFSPGPKQWKNAFWSPRLRQMVYGQVLRDDGLRSLAANVDVVAHEMFHGVTDSTSKLEYVSQSGALNESYSDIFGTIVANRGNDDPRSWDWQVGEKLLPGDRPLRDLSDPTLFGQPAHMDDFRVLAEDEHHDWGGVHVNSGIPNKAAFNLLTAQGTDGTLAVTAAEAAAIFYLALTQRLSRTSQFIDSRRAVVASARTLFRNLTPSEQAKKLSAVERSFQSVGIV